MELKYIHILLNVEDNFLPKAKYVLNTFCRILGLKPKFFTGMTPETIHIYYGICVEEKYPIHIYYNEEAAEFFSKKKLYSHEDVNLVKYRDEYIPFLFSKKGEIFNITSHSVKIRKDIVSSAFYFLSCWQEYAADKEISPSSPYNYHSSLQHHFGFVHFPPVDRYCEMLEDVIKNAFPEYMRSNIWPQGKKFAVSISHNIEYWNFWTDEHIRAMIKRKIRLFRKKSIKALYKVIAHKINQKIYHDPSLLIKKIIKKERSFKTASSIFLLAKTDFPDNRRNYFDKYQDQIIKLFKDSSVNLQGSKEAGYQYKFFPPEWDKLKGFSANGFRIRYLNFNYQNLFKVLEKGEVKFDSSMGYDEHIGYRAGISFPFFPFNIEENRPFNVLEIPVIIMDRSLLNQYGGNIRKAKKHVEMIFKKSRKHKSHISISWHTHIFDKVDFPGWGTLYWMVIKYTKYYGGWLCSLDKMYNYWKGK